MKLLLVLPGWVGDCAMATAALRAIRGARPEARLCGLVRANLAPLYDPCPWLDELLVLPPRRALVPGAWPGGLAGTVRLLKERSFDAAVLFPGSFRSALEVRLAGIPRRIGHASDLRSSLLTDVVTSVPARSPVPTMTRYLELARFLGAVDGSPVPELHTHAEDDARAAEIIRSGGVDASAGLLLLSPGAGTRAAKTWPAERFAELARRCHDELALAVAVNGSGAEREVAARVIAGAGVPVLDLARLGVGLRLLKSLVRSARVVVSNDTGPRHIALALGTPVVTIFGPTDPAHTSTALPEDRHVWARTWCSPCVWRRCPIGHGCMRAVTVDDVFREVTAALGRRDGGPPSPGDAPEARPSVHTG